MPNRSSFARTEALSQNIPGVLAGLRRSATPGTMSLFWLVNPSPWSRSSAACPLMGSPLRKPPVRRRWIKVYWADSAGRRHTFDHIRFQQAIGCFCWCLPAECLAWARAQRVGNGIQFIRTVSTEIRSPWKGVGEADHSYFRCCRAAKDFVGRRSRRRDRRQSWAGRAVPSRRSGPG